MQGDTNTKPNPNETILIPMLHKRVGELTSENILLQARIQWAEHEKAEMLAEVGAKTQRILDLEHAETGKIESAKAEVRAQYEREKTVLMQSIQNERSAFQQEKTTLTQSLETERQKIREEAQSANADALRQERANVAEGLRIRYENQRNELVSRYETEKAELQAQINTLTGTVLSLQSQVNELAEKVPPAPATQPPAPQKPSKRGKKGKEEAAVMGGGTF